MLGGFTTFSAVAVQVVDRVSAGVLAYVVVSNGYGPVEKNTSNGEDAPGDGKTLTLAAVTYTKGLGVHAASEIDVPLGCQYKRFLADVGVDDEVIGGSIVFRVLADGQEIYDSGPMTGDTTTKKVDVDVTGKNTLKLVVDEPDDDPVEDATTDTTTTSAPLDAGKDATDARPADARADARDATPG